MERVVEQRRPRSFHPRKDVLNSSSEELVKRYRLDREGILFVTDLVRDVITTPAVRNKAISPELKVITTLRYLATGKMQLCSSDDLGPLSANHQPDHQVDGVRTLRCPCTQKIHQVSSHSTRN